MRIKSLNILFTAALLASCSDSIETPEIFLNGSAKTPIAIQTNLEASVSSRAVDKKFEAGDVLLAYIEAGQTGTEFTAENQFKGLYSLTLAAAADNTDGNSYANLYGYSAEQAHPDITKTEDSGLQTLYWDDFSSTAYDLRSANPARGIRLKYGYCFNGGEGSDNANGAKVAGCITTALNQATGTLGWTIGDQTTATAFKNADLLFAKTQDPVSYSHGTAETDNHGILVLPYSHAMSKITVNVTADKGFDAETGNFASSVLKLQHMNTVCSVDAPAGTVSSTPTSAAEVTTYKSAAENKTATFQAIVAPGTNLSVGNLIAKISDVDGNNYDIPITIDILSDWADKLTPADKVSYGDIAQAKGSRAATIDAAKGYLAQSGVHYVLNVTIDKQTITVRATLADWDKVTATSGAQIVFNPDVAAKGTIATALQTGGFDIYKSSTNDAFSTKSTTLTYADSKWTYSPIIYWAGQNDNSYFRAVSSSEEPNKRDNKTLKQGIDLLWGTSGNDAITPRTGDVPLTFEHLMSKLSINLETTSGDDKVDLEGAKIAISNMAITTTYNIVDGTVTAGSPVATMLSGKYSGFTEFVIPQTIGNDAKVTITLKDGTTYSVQLNQCKTSAGVAVGSWTKGNSYTYTITLTKQEITFSAVVKQWEEASAGGNATLDWD